MSKKKKMVPCKNCDTMIPAKSKKCPVCGVKNKKPIYKRGWFVILCLVVILSVISSIKGNKRERIEWDDIELAYALPEPDSNVGEIVSNSDKYLSIYIHKTSKDAYKTYINDCKSMGYIIESNKSEWGYTAYGESGHKLSLRYDEDDKEMHIGLDAPMEMGVLTWPESDIASLLPVPKASVGKINRETSDNLFVYVGNTSMEAYAEYVALCAENGFSENYEKGEKYYYADNAAGYHLSVKYQGNSVISIEIERLDEREKEAITEEVSVVETEVGSVPTVTIETEEETIPTKEKPDELINGMRPEFKEAMDDYEAFYDEYCEFMKEYKENPSDLKLIAQYGKLMIKLAEMDESFAKWNEEDLNNTELKYYIEVNSRIAQKLIDVAA